MKVTIRKWRESDAEGLSESLSNIKVQNNLRDGLPFPYTKDDALDYIHAMTSSNSEDTYAFAIDVDGKAVGSIGAFRQGNIHRYTAEVGYYVGQKYWSKGIMTDALKLLSEYIFTKTDIVRLYAEPFAYNFGSRRALEKAGYKLEGILRANAMKNGKLIDMAMYSLIKPQEGIRITRTNVERVPEALDLCWNVFLEFEAPEYSQEGIDSFHSFVSERWRTSALEFYAAYDGDKMVGVIAMRPVNHVSLFFVDKLYQGKGIGKMLFDALKADYPGESFTVNSSPYAVEIYKKLGFSAKDTEKTVDGIRFTPMAYEDR